MGKESISMQMARSMMERTKMIKCMVLGFTLGLMELDMKAAGGKGRCMECLN